MPVCRDAGKPKGKDDGTRLSKAAATQYGNAVRRAGIGDVEHAGAAQHRSQRTRCSESDQERDCDRNDNVKAQGSRPNCKRSCQAYAVGHFAHRKDDFVIVTSGGQQHHLVLRDGWDRNMGN